MSAVRFVSEEALRIAVTSGLVPPEVVRAPVQFERSEQGEVVVRPTIALSEETLEALTTSGAERLVASPGQRVSSWLEIVRPHPLPEVPDLKQVLFFLPDGQRALSLAGEMLRLGCDRQTYCFTADHSMIRAIEPPYFSTLRALERQDGVRAYVPVRAGVYIEAGFGHPLVQDVVVPAGELLLLSGAGEWRRVMDGPWRDIYTLIDLHLPESDSLHEAIEPPRRLTVALRLTRSPTEDTPSLWVLRDRAVDHMDDLVSHLPEDLLQRLLFAVGGPPEAPIVVLRSRLSRQGPVQIDVNGEAYAPLLQINNLYRPSDQTLEPPLRRDRVRELMAPSPAEIAWLALVDEGFRVERIREDSFRPLPDWVDYLVNRDAEALGPWITQAVFSFDNFVSTGLEWSDTPRQTASARRTQDPETPERQSTKGTDPVSPRRRRRRPSDETPEAVTAVPRPLFEYQPSELEERLTELEEEFLGMEAAADAPERQGLWLDMAEINAALVRSRDAGLCWARAVWERSGPDATEAAALWAEGELHLQGQPEPATALDALLSLGAPTREDVRAAISLLVYAATGSEFSPAPARLHQAAVWLDANDEEVDVRALWLGRWAIARLVGGDALGLSRARDRLLQRLHHGLSIERDVPNFLRFLGRGGAGDSSTVSALAAQLEQLWGIFENTERRRSVMEAVPELSRAYVQYVFAYGFARLGRTERAHALREEARRALDQSDEIHRILTAAYWARIDQALEGRPPETPLPPEVSGALNDLSLFVRYKVDRLRQVSRILESQERLDPTTAFQVGAQDPRGPEFLALRGMASAHELGDAVQGIVDQAERAEPDTRARLYDGAMDFFPQLPASRVIPWLEALVQRFGDIAPASRALLLEEALVLAGYFGRAKLVRELVGELRVLLQALEGEQATEVASRLGGSLRGLRRFGLRSEASGLLETMNQIIRGEGTDALVARLNTAAGLAFLGDLDAARPVFESAQKRLKSNLLVTERLRITRGLADALAQTPQDYAIAGLTELTTQLPEITDSLATNTHFCLSLVQYMEAIVLGYASEHLVIGERGRRWLDEDEYLVRRRIHHDLGEPT